MARTIYPLEADSTLFSFTAQNTRRPLSGDEAAQQQRERTEEEQSYLERVQNYIPAEIVAIFVFVNSLVSTPLEDGRITPEGWVAVGAVLVCLVACFVFARVAARQVENPSFRFQGWMFAIALLIWIYAMDAKVLEVVGHNPIPSLSGLLLVTFTVFSGLVVPTVKPAGPAPGTSNAPDSSGTGKTEADGQPHVSSQQHTAPAPNSSASGASE